MLSAGKPITFLPVDFAGHALGDRTPWINTAGSAVFHPTAAGYAEYSRVLVKLLGKAK